MSTRLPSPRSGSIVLRGALLLIASCGEPDDTTGLAVQVLTQDTGGSNAGEPSPPSSCQRDPGGYQLSDIAADPNQGFLQIGSSTGSRFGAALAAAGDLNLDGRADVFIGAPGSLSGRGSAFIYLGDQYNVLFPFRRFDGETGAQAGNTLAVANNGRFYTAGNTYSNNTGRLYGTQATSTNSSLINALVRVTGSSGSNTGASLATRGNIVGSSELDLAVGAPTYSGVGAVYVLPGQVVSGNDPINTTTRYAVRIQGTLGSDFGRSVILMDLNGDGNDDLLVGAPGYHSGDGAVFAFFGPFSFPLDLSLGNANVRLDGDAQSRAGSALAAVPDLDGDGIDELLVGAPDHTLGAGRVYQVSGSTTWSAVAALSSFPSLVGENPGDRAGAALAAGDVNADGHADLVVGAPGYASGSGAAYLVYGASDPLPPVTGLGSQVRFEGDAHDQAGTSVLVAGDITGDGAGDILIGAPGNSGNAGAAYLVFGMLLRVYYHDADHDGYGSSTDTIDACTQPDGYVLVPDNNLTDCNDANPDINPGALELCNNIDDNCNDITDIDADSPPRWIVDLDEDGFGNPFGIVDQCTPPTTGHWIPYDDTAPTECGGTFDDANLSDRDKSIHMGALEICDFKDNDCDGHTDDKTVLFYIDADGDGFGNPNYDARSATCDQQPVGYVQNKDDCNDADKNVNPNTPWYRDADGDAFGDTNGIKRSCTQPPGYVGNSNDCDDAEPLIKDGLLWYHDADGDGHGFRFETTISCTMPEHYVTLSDDCNDNDPNIHPGQPEVCDNIDNNCNGTADDGVLITYYVDADHDGFGSDNADYVRTGCTRPAGYSDNNLDCNDINAAYNPNTVWHIDADGDGYGGSATANSCTQPIGHVLNATDCDDSDPTVLDGRSWYQDSDNDGHGNLQVRVYTCTAPAGYVASSDDCNPIRADIYPGAPELCDKADNNCDSNIDEGVQITYYADFDGDGFGSMNLNFSRQDCTLPAGYVTNNDDCNDRDEAINPNTVWYADADNDGHGNMNGNTTHSCTRPNGYINNQDDCDDSRGDVYPGAPEKCDPPRDGLSLAESQIDYNCNGKRADDPEKDGESAPLWWGDNDRDGYAKDAFAVRSCLPPTEPGVAPMPETNPNVFGYYKLASTVTVQDCNDSLATVHPHAPELCDNLDNDCDNDVDEGAKTRFYYDNDGDGCGGSTTLYSCGFCIDEHWVRKTGDPNDNDPQQSCD